ncbi:MAG TPA: energy transducer TonB [Bacteroidales bacterium]|nr:energy transducer TonB [Bacteroidales bacterium]HNS47449.1 energy transducer TonB [Bacteroidales bacterium]
MDPRKTEKSDLESKRTLFTQIGLIVVLAIVLLAFEWKQYERAKLELGARDNIEVIEEVIIQTEQEMAKPPAPTPPPQTTILEIVDDDVTIEDDIMIDAESDENTQMEEYVAPPPSAVEADEEEIEEAEIFTVVEESPSFPGGEEARIRFLQENIEYPQMARESGIQGTVYMTFVVEPSGSVSAVRVLRGIGGGCDEEAIRVIQKMPRWNPGKQRGKPVRVQFTMPIKFTLQG